MNVRGVGIDPEIMALRITIEMQAQAVATHLTHEKESEAGQRQQVPPSVSTTSSGPACSLRDPVLAGSLSAECKVGTLHGDSCLPKPQTGCGKDYRSLCASGVSFCLLLLLYPLNVPRYAHTLSHGPGSILLHLFGTSCCNTGWWQASLPTLFLPLGPNGICLYLQAHGVSRLCSSHRFPSKRTGPYSI